MKTNISKRNSAKRIDDFLRGMGQWALVLFTLGFLFAGVQLATNPYETGRWQFIGWMLVVITGTTVILTVSRWARILPAIFVYGALRFAFSSFDGHSAANPLPVSTEEYLLIYLLVIGSAILSLRYASRNSTVTLTDRLCLVSIVAFISVEGALQAAQSRRVGHPVNYYNDFLLTFAVSLGLLLIAWSLDRFRRSVYHRRAVSR